MASGNTSSAAPAEPVGNRMCVPLPAGISAVTFIFPLSGSAGAPAAVSGTYWPATFDRPGYFYSCAVTGSSAVVTPIVNVDLGYSVRCVRAREEQAIPCFFPLAGSSVAPGELCGYYWTTDFVPNAGAVYLRLDGATVRFDFAANGELFSVRCVRARE